MHYHLTLPMGSIKVRNHLFYGSQTIGQWSPFPPDVAGGLQDGDTLTVVCTFNLNPDISPQPPAHEYVGLCVGACAKSNPAAATALLTQAQRITLGTPASKGSLLGTTISTASSRPSASFMFYAAQGSVMPAVTLGNNRGTLSQYIYRWTMTYNGQNTVAQNGDDVEIVYGYGDPQSGEVDD